MIFFFFLVEFQLKLIDLISALKVKVDFINSKSLLYCRERVSPVWGRRLENPSGRRDVCAQTTPRIPMRSLGALK